MPIEALSTKGADAPSPVPIMTSVQTTTMTVPTPLLTILSPDRYPYAVAQVHDGKITSTLSYATTLEDCYFQVQGWRSSMGSAAYIMAEQREINGKSYWVAV